MSIKETLKKSDILLYTVRKVRKAREDVKKQYKMLQVSRNPLQANKELYKRNHGEYPNLENPSNFNEKCMWLVHNVYCDNELVTRCADKYLMRDYVKEKGLEKLLPELYGVWDKPSQIDWDSLPQQFVMKCNHGCGCNIFCRDKSKLDTKAAEKKLRHWMCINFANYFGEINYKNIKKKIIAEEFIDDGINAQPDDYKILCFNGEPKMHMVCNERAVSAKFMFTDLDYKQYPIDIGHHSGGTLPPKPDNLDEMVEYARILSQDFPFVRVDFYSVKGKIYIGEMTFSPLGCAIDYINDEGLQMMGDWLDISEYKKD